MQRGRIEEIERECDDIIREHFVIRKKELKPEERSYYSFFISSKMIDCFSCYFNQLSNDILKIILDYSKKWKIVSLVCKRWRNVCKKICMEANIPRPYYDKKRSNSYYQTIHDCYFLELLANGYCKNVFICLNYSNYSGTAIYMNFIFEDVFILEEMYVSSDIKHLSISKPCFFGWKLSEGKYYAKKHDIPSILYKLNDLYFTDLEFRHWYKSFSIVFGDDKQKYISKAETLPCESIMKKSINEMPHYKNEIRFVFRDDTSEYLQTNFNNLFFFWKDWKL